MKRRSASLAALLLLLIPLPAAAQPPSSEEASPDGPPSRRENRIRDHAVGVGYYLTHLQWKDTTTDSFPNYNMHSLAIRYAYYVGQAEGFGFMINAAVVIPMRLSQHDVVTNPALNRTYVVRDTYRSVHVGFDVSLMAGTHRMLTERLAMIAGLGLHLGSVRMNDEELRVHEYVAVGIAGAFSLRYHLDELWTVGADITASSDYRDMVDHTNPLDWTINLGITANAGLHF